MFSRTRPRLAATLLATAAFSFVPYALAQEANDANEQTEERQDGEARLNRVVVTSTKREADTLELPLSVTALSGEDLVNNSQDELADYIRQVPGITFRQLSAGLNQISIRGVSGGGGQRAKAPISFYIDDIPVVSDPVATPDVKSFDVQRVEVLRGPQGTLFGESALGGVIRVITNDPDASKHEARARATYLTFEGGDSGYNFDGMVNIPIVKDELAVRATVSRRDEGGWIDNIGIGGRENANDLDYWTGRVKALWTPTDLLRISGTASLTRSEYGSRQEANQNYQQTINYTDETRTDDIDQYNLTVSYDLGFAELTSSTNSFKRETSRLFNLNTFNGFLPGLLRTLGAAPTGFVFDEFYQTLNIDDKTFVQEIRLVSPDDSNFRWVGGLYYFDTDNDVGVDFIGVPDLNFNYLRLRRDEQYDQSAVFAEAEYDFADRFTIVGGLRYTEESRTIIYDQTDDFPFTVFLPANGLFQADIDYDILTPKVALQYRPSDNTQVYVSATRGFRGPGGNTDFNDAGARNNVYGAETIWSYEVGAKGAFLSDRLILETAAFMTDWNDRQEVVNPEAPPTAQFADNIGTAEILGAELVASLQLNDYIALGGNVSYIDTEITSSARTAFVGKPLPGESNWRGSGFIDFRYPLQDGLDLRARIDGTYSGDVIFSLTNPVEQGAYNLFNAQIGVEADDWSLTAFSRNATDEFIKYGAGFSTSVNEPRSYGISLDYTF